MAHKPRAYVDGWDNHQPRESIFVHEETKSARVTYEGDGAKFRVMIHTRPNPIGFRAQLPGDRRK